MRRRPRNGGCVRRGTVAARNSLCAVCGLKVEQCVAGLDAPRDLPQVIGHGQPLLLCQVGRKLIGCGLDQQDGLEPRIKLPERREPSGRIHGVTTGPANKDGPPDDITGTPPSVADLED